MKELIDFSSLEEAQNYTETKQKMLSPDTMLAYLTAFDLLDILDNPTTKETKGLAKAFSFGSEFNLMTGHPLDQTAMLTQMVSDGVVPQEFKDFLLAQANSEVKPLASKTQEDWDKAQATLAPTKLEATYPDGIYYVMVNKENVALQVTVDTPCAYDDELLVTAQTKGLSDGSVFAVSEPIRARIKIPADFTGTILSNPVNTSGLSRHIKFFLQSKYNRTFIAETINVL